MAGLPIEVTERLGPFYVYVLVDPRNDQIFYVGKGTGERLLHHGREADLARDRSTSAKTDRIQEIRKDGIEPQLDIVRHGLSEPEALLVEASLIDCLADLTNKVAGHGTDGSRGTLSEYLVRYGADSVADDAPPALLIRLSKWRDLPEQIEPGVWRRGNGYRPDMSQVDLFNSTRAWWKVSEASVQRRGIEYAVAVHEGITRGVLRIGDWTTRDDGRRAFGAMAVEDNSVVDAWVGEFGRRVEFTAAAQNPISYWPKNVRSS